MFHLVLFFMQTCIGGLVIDNNGEVIGLITSHLPQSAILSISIVKKCIQMWNKFGYVLYFIVYIKTILRRLLVNDYIPSRIIWL